MGQGRRALLFVAAVVATAAGTPGAASAFERPAKDSLSSTVDSVPSSRAISAPEGITIHNAARGARHDPIVVYSVHLSEFKPPEPIRVSGTVAPSYCVGSDINGSDREVSPCRELAHDHIPNPHYPIQLKARIYRADSSSDPGTSDDETLAQGRVRCKFAAHHCPLTLRADADLSGGAGHFVNLALSAWTRSPDWHEPDRMDLDCFPVDGVCQTNPANAVDPADPQQLIETHGRLGVIRFGAAYPKTAEGAPVSAASDRIDDATVTVDPGSFAKSDVIHSSRIDDLAPGDAIEVSGSAELTGDGFDHFGGSYWVLARSPTTRVAAAGTPDRYLSAFNGVNCLGESRQLTGTTSGYCSSFRDPPTLPLQQAGIGKVPNGAPPTMYLNFVVIASDLTFPMGTTPSAVVDTVTTDVGCDPLPRPVGQASCSIATP